MNWHFKNPPAGQCRLTENFYLGIPAAEATAAKARIQSVGMADTRPHEPPRN
jgi:hypothetical protein